MNLFQRKNVTDLQAEALADQSLHRALGPVNLTALGVGAIIGTGIFVLTAAAAQKAGPGMMWRFVIAGFVCTSRTRLSKSVRCPTRVASTL